MTDVGWERLGYMQVERSRATWKQRRDVICVEGLRDSNLCRRESLLSSKDGRDRGWP